jgi:hypothetical protein
VVYSKIQSNISAATPNETGGFLLAYPVEPKNKKAPFFVVQEEIDYNEQKWNEQETAFLEPKTSYVSDSSILADRRNASLIFYHSHPGSGYLTTFSSIDKSGNKKLLPNLSQLLDDRVVGSLVFSKSGFDGIALCRGKWQTIGQLSVVGSRLTRINNGISSTVAHHSKPFLRQIAAVGETSQSIIQSLRVAVVGAGGVGSAVALQLSKLGVGVLHIVDPDKVEETNLHRLYCATRRDIGKPKASVVARYLSRVGFSKKVTHSETSVMTDRNLNALLTMDAVICCTDNQRSRSFLNDLSYQYCIPVVDAGCRVVTDPVPQSASRVQVLGPGRACLWCTGVLDGKVLVQETMSDDELERLRSEGYAGPQNQPGLITLTTTTASLAVLRLLNLTTSYGDDCPTRTLFELLSGALVIDEPAIQNGCVCRKRTCVGGNRPLATEG